MWRIWESREAVPLHHEVQHEIVLGAGVVWFSPRDPGRVPALQVPNLGEDAVRGRDALDFLLAVVGSGLVGASARAPKLLAVIHDQNHVVHVFERDASNVRYEPVEMLDCF